MSELLFQEAMYLEDQGNFSAALDSYLDVLEVAEVGKYSTFKSVGGSAAVQRKAIEGVFALLDQGVEPDRFWHDRFFELAQQPTSIDSTNRALAQAFQDEISRKSNTADSPSMVEYEIFLASNSDPEHQMMQALDSSFEGIPLQIIFLEKQLGEREEARYREMLEDALDRLMPEQELIAS